jgi:hypothetical protein
MPAADWRALSRDAGWSVRAGAITVRFDDGRLQRVWVDDSDPEVIRVWSVAATPSRLRRVSDPDLLAWERNRQSDLVGFKTDRRGRLVGEAWVPRAGLGSEEWSMCVAAVARSCDRLEYLLTGKDAM